MAMAQHPEEKPLRYFVFVCDTQDPPHPMEVGFTAEEYDYKDCPCKAPLRAVEMVEALVAERLAKAAEAYLNGRPPPQPRVPGTYTSEEMRVDLEWQASLELARELRSALRSFSGEATPDMSDGAGEGERNG